MRLYQLGKLGGLDALQLKEAEIPRPRAGQVAVRIRACALNHRDLNIISGNYTSVALKPGAIPISDGAGEVTEVGPDVTRWKVGDRVAPIFVQRWLGGDLLPEYAASALGGPSDGVLAETIVLSEEGLVRIPSHLSFEQAATLPCAAVTAWNAALVKGQLQPGHTVVTLGTGGVSLFTTQLALMTGARVIATTGSNEKIERLRELGVSEDVRFLGRLDSVASVLQASDLFILPSQTESFGLAALEAMACGAPVVASRAGGLTEVIDDEVNGILEPVGSVEAMGRRAVELLRDPERHAAMRAAAIAKAQDFSADRIVPMYEAFYEEVLA